jgi:hypothetical protein
LRIHPSCLRPWFISFAAQYVIKGAAQNRDRSTLIVFCELPQIMKGLCRTGTAVHAEPRNIGAGATLFQNMGYMFRWIGAAEIGRKGAVPEGTALLLCGAQSSALLE